MAERYQGALEHFDRPPTPVTADTPLLSWSMAKSVLHAVVGPARRRREAGPRRPRRRARVGRPGRPAPRHHPAPAARHARRARLRGGLRRRRGLRHDPDALRGRPGATWRTSPPTARWPRRRARVSTTRRGRRTSFRASWPAPWGRARRYARFLHGRLFGPLGMTSADPEFDEAGTWVASSSLYATARDYARFGLLYLRDGVWDGVRLLPDGMGRLRPHLGLRGPRGRQPLRRPLVGRGRRHARHLPRLGLRGPVHHALPEPRPDGGATRQDAARARGATSSRGATPWCRPSPAPAEPARAQALFGVATNTGICRSVFSWYSA